MSARPFRPLGLVARPLLLGAFALTMLGCDLLKHDQPGSQGSCPATVPLGRGCTTANQVCSYEEGGKKYRCTCTPDTTGPSMWSCPTE